MKTFKTLVLYGALVAIAISLNAQLSFDSKHLVPTVKAYSNCAAVFYKDKMLVDEYSPKGTCKLEQGMKGKLSLYTVELAEGKGTPKTGLEFKVAIKNKQTNTIYMYSDDTFTEVMLEDVLSKCQLGDNILIMTVDQEIALTHHEIEILWKC